MISCASCQQSLALRSETLTPAKTKQFNKQKATWNISCTVILFCLILYPELTAWQERWKCWAPGDSGSGRLGQGCSSTWTLNIRANIMANPRSTINKLEYGCLATDLTLITEVSLYLTASPDGSRQGDMATFLYATTQSTLRGRYSTVAVCSDRLLERKPV